MSSALEGRVFERLRQFKKLPEDVQAHVKTISEFLVESNAFGPETANLVKSVVGIKSDALTTKVHEKLTAENTDATKEQALAVVDGLVLSGFLALYREKDAENATKLEKFSGPKALFLPTDSKLANRPNDVSVWSVREGAIQAGTLNRAHKSLFGTSVKEAYVVANDNEKTLYFFDSDHALNVSDKFALANAHVQFDDSIQFGIKVSNETAAVVIGTSSKEKQDEWLNSIINAGATYREVFNVVAESVESFYELKDFDMQGNEVLMEKYKGKVILVVNVSSLCGLTPTNYPELTQLYEKYKDEGLEILAFPCNQFARQEPGTHEEIMEFVKKYNATYPFFEKHDVNGADARPVFTYLKAKLPGSFGNFVKWNFTKFLVDRNGKPYKRFAPKDLPLSFEEDIKFLLAQKPESAEEQHPEATEAKEETATETTEEKTKVEEEQSKPAATAEETAKSTEEKTDAAA